ncbi:outer membrane beta-barrel protein [Hymenobacter qilianensis]|uniref:Outer membrane beta-barrel protein n=1 Tax=Hymenobacter qilianensis TaxID=1385715 RepID=A0A7H0GXZ6_9BACT|nr:outer membrane beta-barrel protein [Hymenobacter qilianensis]QNP53162.1 outer membrane beta-barrel protein [Hymenobacter qilianensis]
MLKTLPLAVFLLAAGQFAQAQNQTKRAYEAGIEVVNYNPSGNGHRYANSPANNPAQWVSGVFLRYTPTRFGVRLGGNFSQGTVKPNYDYCADCLTSDITDKELQVKLGAQYAPLKKYDWLYVFTDLYYRRYTSTGDLTGGRCGCLDVTETRTSNGLGLNAGLGAKIRVYKSFYLSPEIYYDVLRARDETTSRDNLNGSPDFTYQETTTMHRPAMRLRATIAF